MVSFYIVLSWVVVLLVKLIFIGALECNLMVWIIFDWLNIIWFTFKSIISRRFYTQSVSPWSIKYWRSWRGKWKIYRRSKWFWAIDISSLFSISCKYHQGMPLVVHPWVVPFPVVRRIKKKLLRKFPKRLRPDAHLRVVWTDLYFRPRRYRCCNTLAALNGMNGHSVYQSSGNPRRSECYVRIVRVVANL